MHDVHTRRQHFWLDIMLLLVLTIPLATNTHAQTLPVKNILVLNSYHQGYKWADDITSGINSVMGAATSNIHVQTEYMDTQHIADARYLLELKKIYSYKFRNKKFEVIIAADDPAFSFLLKYRNILFPGIPIVFCGVNHFVDSMLNGHDDITGVVEDQDIKATLELALKLHPQTRNVYVINDNTMTGKSIGKALDEITPLFTDRVRFIPLGGRSMEQIQQKVANLPPHSLVLYLIFFEDGNGVKFSYSDSIARISPYSTAPIYGNWEFSLDHGIVGGMLASGFYQGEMAAKMAERILNGEQVSAIPVIKSGSNRYMFDRVQLNRFQLNSTDLPPDSIIINESDTSRKQILILNSYHYGMTWSDGIISGITSAMGDKTAFNLQFEFMDTKQNVGPEYTQNLHQLYRYKYQGKKYDLIITSDDDAYNLARKYHNELFPNVPIVFCGVNFFQADNIKHDRLITGIVEAVDIRKTLELALNLHPGTKKIIVINDQTATGKANKNLLDTVLPDFPTVQFQLYGNINMSELEERVARLTSDSLILLMSFNKDKSNNTFSYEESIRRIAVKTSVPIYGVWDFYLGNGIVGGMLTNGYTQGEMAAKMGMRILAGEQLDKMPVVTTSPNRYMFDYRYLRQFAINPNTLPPQSVIINRPHPLLEKYRRSLIVTLSILLTLAGFYFYRHKKNQNQLKLMATTDPLTGIMNRQAGTAYLKRLIKSAKLLNTHLTICFVDLDDLKKVNDTLGHQEGDRYLQQAILILQQKIRKADLICRFGGDEFVLAISNCNRHQAEVFWEKAEEAMRDFNQNATMPFTISMSRGFAEYNPNTPMSLAELISMADTEMYAFKQQRKTAGLVGKPR